MVDGNRNTSATLFALKQDNINTLSMDTWKASVDTVHLWVILGISQPGMDTIQNIGIQLNSGTCIGILSLQLL